MTSRWIWRRTPCSGKMTVIWGLANRAFEQRQDDRISAIEVLCLLTASPYEKGPISDLSLHNVQRRLRNFWARKFARAQTHREHFRSLLPGRNSMLSSSIGPVSVAVTFTRASSIFNDLRKAKCMLGDCCASQEELMQTCTSLRRSTVAGSE